jgi:hypothetical protein
MLTEELASGVVVGMVVSSDLQDRIKSRPAEVGHVARGVAAADIVVDGVVRRLEGVTALTIRGHDGEGVGTSESQVLQNAC